MASIEKIGPKLNLGIKMIKIPAGKFTFQGVKGVAFNGCKLAETKFTNGQFRGLLENKPTELSKIVADPEKRLRQSLEVAFFSWEAETCPFVIVDQTEAAGIAHLLGKRLPTWIEQCRARTYTDGRLFPFGNSFDINKVTVNMLSDRQGTRSVYERENGRSLEGLYDLDGNGLEWSSSPYGKIDLSDPLNPKFPQSGTEIVLACGAWHLSATEFLSQLSYQDKHDLPERRTYYYGFRLAEDIWKRFVRVC
jgi:formylglycine-generating enzyme required for sulfatase activity